MAPLNGRKHPRKLQERGIATQQGKLGKTFTTQLDARLPEKKRSTFIWVAVAASFVGILLLTALWMQNPALQPKFGGGSTPFQSSLDGTWNANCNTWMKY